mgnify:CR=1 FL=1
MNKEELYKIACNARKNAYAKHTPYYVGAALVTKTGKVYSGCNIQNDGLNSLCAERVAFVKAISSGEKEFSCILVVGGPTMDTLERCLPCGICRQFMSEFVDEDFKVIVGSPENFEEFGIKELLPHSFNL